MKYNIYQSNVRGIRGFSKEFNEKDLGKAIQVSDPDFGYNLVLTHELTPLVTIDATLELIYSLMNQHSSELRDIMNAMKVNTLSMGDIVEFNDCFYYVDEFGFSIVAA